MMPNVSSVFSNWTSPVQLRVVVKRADDFQLREDVMQIAPFEAVMQPMKAQSVDRKPEGVRQWRWWEAWTQQELAPDAVVQDQDGLQFRVQAKTNWAQGGFFHYEMTEQPNDA